MNKPSALLRSELETLLNKPGQLGVFCNQHGFNFNSVYKIATGAIEQPGLDYGFELLSSLEKIELVNKTINTG